MENPSRPNALSPHKLERVARISSSKKGFAKALASSMSSIKKGSPLILGLYSSISNKTLQKELTTSSFTSSSLVNLLPFLLLQALAILQKNREFLSPSLNHNYGDFCLHEISSILAHLLKSSTTLFVTSDSSGDSPKSLSLAS